MKATFLWTSVHVEAAVLLAVVEGTVGLGEIWPGGSSETAWGRSGEDCWALGVSWEAKEAWTSSGRGLKAIKGGSGGGGHCLRGFAESLSLLFPPNWSRVKNALMVARHKSWKSAPNTHTQNK